MDDSLTTQVVSGDGKFDAEAMQHLSNSVKLHECGLSYAVVAVLGPQSGGKSTLLNHLFHTNFRMMDALQGRNQTTQGIWMAKAAGVEPLTLVMDVEGSDSQERGEDGAAFEKQSALFAVAIADIVIINMWCHDIGRQVGSSKPLHKTVFEVLLRLFRTTKTTLLYVIRDKTKTPFDILERRLREDVQKLWDSLPKPDDLKDTPLSEFFNVEVTALSSYEEKEEEFKKETAELRQRFFHSVSPGGLAYSDGRRRSAEVASEFCSSTQQIWKTIKEDKDLDLPAHRIMVATIRCEAIVKEKLVCFQSDNDWLALKEGVQAAGAVSGFGKRASTILKTYLSQYDVESHYFDENVRNEKRHDLLSKALQFVYPSYENLLKILSSTSFESFKTQLQQHLGGGEGFAAAVRTSRDSSIVKFDAEIWDWTRMDIHAALEQANWDALKKEHAELLRSNIEAHASLQLEEKLRKLEDVHKKKLCKALKKPVRSLFDAAGGSTWASIRTLLGRESDAAGSAISSAIAGFELDEPTAGRLVHDLKEYGTKLVEEVARERAAQALPLLKDRFYWLISNDEDCKPKGNVTEEEFEKIVVKILQKCLTYLSIMAVIRLDGDTDDVETVLSSALLMDGSGSGSGSGSGDPLASNTWDDVPPERTLITPIECSDLWEKFKEEMDRQIRASKDLLPQQAEEPSKSSPFRKAATTFMQVIGAPLLYQAAKAIKEVLDDKTVACQLCGIRGHSALHCQDFQPQVLQPPLRQWQLLESGDEFNNHDGTHEHPLLTDGSSLPISHTDHGSSRFEQPTQPWDSGHGRFSSQPTPRDSTVVCQLCRIPGHSAIHCQYFQHQGHGGASGSGSA